jgi:hypothetical protein
LTLDLLERDVVRVDVTRSVVRSGNVVVGCAGASRSCGAACVAATAGSSRLQELDVVGDDLCDPPLLTVLTLP